MWGGVDFRFGIIFHLHSFERRRSELKLLMEFLVTSLPSSPHRYFSKLNNFFYLKYRRIGFSASSIIDKTAWYHICLYYFSFSISIYLYRQTEFKIYPFNYTLSKFSVYFYFLLRSVFMPPPSILHLFAHSSFILILFAPSPFNPTSLCPLPI